MNLGQNLAKKQLVLASFVLLTTAVVGILTADHLLQQDPRIRPNVQVASVDIGGLLPAEAERKLSESTKLAAVALILVTDQKNNWYFQPADIDFIVDVRGSIAIASEVGHEPDFLLRWKQRLVSDNQIRNLPAAVAMDRTKLAKALKVLAAQTDRQAKDAFLTIVPKTKTVMLTPAVVGRKLEIEQTVSQAFQTPQNQLPFVINLIFTQQAPKITDDHYAGINTVLATYTTSFNSWDSERNANLRLATGRIHGTLLKPGETFSYNQIVGHRTQQEGFRMAPVILDGKLVPDWGGGVCQVSSTLYNAALLADLDIVDRSNHGRAIGYVPLGFDATVVDGQIDFKFKNNLKRPVLLHSVLSDNELAFSILGDAKDAPPPIELDYVVHKVIEPIEIKQPDATLEVGKEVVDESPQRGFRVSTYRIRTINGKQVSQLLSTDDYDPVNRIIKVGTKPTKTAGTAASAPGGSLPTADKAEPSKVQSGTIKLQGQTPRVQTSIPDTSSTGVRP